MLLAIAVLQSQIGVSDPSLAGSFNIDFNRLLIRPFMIKERTLKR